MASSAKTVDGESGTTSVEQPDRKATVVSRRALLGARRARCRGARRGAGAHAHPHAGRTVVPSGELRLLRRVTNGRDARGRRLDQLARLLRLPRVAAQRRGDGRSRLRGAAGAVSRRSSCRRCRSTAPDSTTVITRSSPRRPSAAPIYSNRQLLERMVEFWTDHFNTNITTVGILKTLDDRDVYRRKRSAPSRHAERAARRARRCSTYLNNTQSDGRPGPRRTRTTRASSWSCTRSASTAATPSRTSSKWRAASPAGARRQQHRRRPRRARSSTTPTATTTTASSCSAYRSRPAAASTTASTSCKSSRSIRAPPASSRKKLLRWLLDYDPSPALVADVAGEFTRTRRRHQGDRPPHPALRQRALGAAALQASVPLHRLGAARDERERDLARHDPRHLSDRHGQHRRSPGARPTATRRSSSTGAACRCRAGTSRSSCANNSVSGAAVDCRRCSRARRRAVQIADRIDALLFAGEMPAADKAALITYLRPTGTAPCRRDADSRRVRSGARLAGVPVALTQGRNRPEARSDTRSATVMSRNTPNDDCQACDEYRQLSRREFMARTTATAVALSVARVAAARHLRPERRQPRTSSSRSSCAAAPTACRWSRPRASRPTTPRCGRRSRSRARQLRRQRSISTASSACRRRWRRCCRRTRSGTCSSSTPPARPTRRGRTSTRSSSWRSASRAT